MGLALLPVGDEPRLTVFGVAPSVLTDLTALACIAQERLEHLLKVHRYTGKNSVTAMAARMMARPSAITPPPVRSGSVT